MAKLESTFKNMVLVLCGISIFAAGALGVVYKLTLDPIKAAELANQEAAIRKVVPQFDNSPVQEKYALISPEGDSLMCFPAKQNGLLTGVAIESFSKKGFHGEVRVMVGLDPKGKILNYSVLKHTETPGLGSKMEEWFRTDKKNQNILGLDPGKNKVWVSKDGGEVDGITAATISSRAFLDAIDRAYRSYMASLNIEIDAHTSASALKVKEKVNDTRDTVSQEIQTKHSVKKVTPKKDVKPVSEVKNQPEVTKEKVDAQTAASEDYSK